MKIKNKAQINMMESIAVLLVFFVLVFIGFIFYVKVIRGNIDIEVEEARQLEAVEIAQRAIFLPELQCSEDNIVKPDCIDILKLDAAADIIRQNQIYYYDRLGFSKIFVKELYPNDRNWILYDRPLVKFEDNATTYLPISIYDPKEREHSFGIMQVEVYTK